MDVSTTLRLVGGLILLLANAFFVAAEFGLTRLRQYDFEDIEEDERLNLAWEMTHRLEIYLTSCQIGITTTSILLGVIAEPAVTLLIESMIGAETLGSGTSHSISIVLSVVLINIAHTIWGEQTPTYLGVERALSVSRHFAAPLYWWTKMIYPLLYIGDQATKGTLALFGISMERTWLREEEGKTSPSDIKSHIADLLKSEGMPAERRKEVLRALEIDEVPVRDIMVPRDQMSCLSTKMSLKENLEIIRKQIRSRYPLVAETPDEYLGIIYSKELLAQIEDIQNGRMKLDDLSRKDLTVSPDLPVSQLIDRFQEEHQELALVMSDGQTLGLVTLTDALEVIVGSAEDPSDLEWKQHPG